jgi:hypothetical protein
MAQQICVVLSAAERERLAAITADRNRPRKHVDRARIVLISADRHSAQRVAQSIGVSRADGLALATTRCRERGRGSIARQDLQARQGADRRRNHGAGGGVDVHRTAAHQATHWTNLAMAKVIGISVGSVSI